MKVYNYDKSFELYDRAEKVVPCGLYGHLGVGRARLNPMGCYPLFADRAEGAYIWDVDGNRFIDYACAYGPNVLGYQDPDVEAAALAQAQKGNCTTVVSPVMIECAEELVNTVNCADWAFFAKNGGDVTTLAVMTARHATGRDRIIMMKHGYHGVTQWCQTPGTPGVLDEDICHNLYAEFNDYEGLKALVEKYRGEIACIISMPYNHISHYDNVLPDEDYWPKVRRLCDEHGILLIIDDVRAGFRMDIAGSDHYFGIKADMLALGKAIANGWNLSALVGVKKLKPAVEDMNYTGSYWLSAVPLAASTAALRKMKEIHAVEKMQEIGAELTKGLVEVADANNTLLKATGLPSLFKLILKDPDESLIAHQKWVGEMVRRGVYISHFHNMFTNTMITKEDLQYTFDAADEALKLTIKEHPEILIR
ncbi:MAG: aminotransferase class III-fold pyridoxal phosphate-dependent enzyme [Dorea sp.]|nr:aminotransferase class III-fold pyridoxal phosphate-dependent enzyme [Dorea sp.]